MADKSAEGSKPDISTQENKVTLGVESTKPPQRRVGFVGTKTAAIILGATAFASPFIGHAGEVRAGGGPDTPEPPKAEVQVPPTHEWQVVGKWHHSRENLIKEGQESDLPASLLERHPELKGLKAVPLDVEGAAVDDNLATGTKVYKMHLQDGQRFRTTVSQNNMGPLTEIGADGKSFSIPSFELSQVLDADGRYVGYQGNTVVETAVVNGTGDYYLMVSQDPNAPKAIDMGISVEALNPLDHGVNMALMRDPNTPYEEEMIIQPEDLAARAEETAVVLNIHQDAGYSPTSNWSDLVKVYAASGVPDDLEAPHVVLPEFNKKNLLANCRVDPRQFLDENGNTRLIKLVITCSRPDGTIGFPPGNQVAITLGAPDGSSGYNWVERFFTTSPREVPPVPAPPYLPQPLPPGDRV